MSAKVFGGIPKAEYQQRQARTKAAEKAHRHRVRNELVDGILRRKGLAPDEPGAPLAPALMAEVVIAWSTILPRPSVTYIGEDRS